MIPIAYTIDVLYLRLQYFELTSKTYKERYLLLNKILAQQSINDHIFK